MTHWNHFKQVFGTSGYKAMGSFPPHSVMFFLCPLQRPHSVCHPAHVPTQGCVPTAPRGALQTHSLQGCSTGTDKRYKWWKIVLLMTRFSVAEARGTENAPFLEQAPEAVTPGQTLISPCIAVNPHPRILKNRSLAARFQLLQKLIATTKNPGCGTLCLPLI